MRNDRRLVLLLCVGALAACGDAKTPGSLADGNSDGSEVDTDPCARRECGTFGGRSCGICEASAVPFNEYDPNSSTYCDEQEGVCGGLKKDCLDGWCVVPAGSFQAGWDFAATEPFVEPPPHRVRLTRAFRIQQTEVTQRQWLEVMATNPSPFPGCGLDCPVSGMSWFDAIAYANRLSERDGLEPCYRSTNCDAPLVGDILTVCDSVELIGLDCPGYRLPTEYEWEHAARAGSPACFSNQQLDYPTDLEPWCTLRPEIDPNAWYCGNSAIGAVVDECIELGHTGICATPHPVGLKRENRFGLHDMYGNVDEYTTSPWRSPSDMGDIDHVLIDPLAGLRVGRNEPVVARGASYASGTSATCSAYRSPAGGEDTSLIRITGMTGFRLVQTLPAR